MKIVTVEKARNTIKLSNYLNRKNSNTVVGGWNSKSPLKEFILLIDYNYEYDLKKAKKIGGKIYRFSIYSSHFKNGSIKGDDLEELITKALQELVDQVNNPNLECSFLDMVKLSVGQ